MVVGRLAGLGRAGCWDRGRRSIYLLLLSLPPAVSDTGKNDDNGDADETSDDNADNSCSVEGDIVVVVVVTAGG